MVDLLVLTSRLTKTLKVLIHLNVTLGQIFQLYSANISIYMKSKFKLKSDFQQIFQFYNKQIKPMQYFKQFMMILTYITILILYKHNNYILDSSDT
jgi:hypothetical protein